MKTTLPFAERNPDPLSAAPLRTVLLHLPIMLFLLLAGFIPGTACAEELEMINRPVNSSGLTGLIYTTMPWTLPKRTFEAGLMTTSENSFKPDYTLTSYPLTVSYGVGQNSEAALRATYWHTQESDVDSSRGFGDTELSYKWNIRPQQERSSVPGIALLATGILPTGDKDAGTNMVQHWGMRVGLSAGSEIELDNYILGVYADCMVAVQDLSDNRYRDRYQLLDLGAIFPISKYRNLQLIIEYNRMGGRDHPTLHQVDYSAITYGLRLVKERFNLTVGSQFMHKSAEGYEDSSRLSGLISVKL